MKEIKLTHDKVALVDDADFERLNQWKWYYTRSGNNEYAGRSVWVDGGNQTRMMHRDVLDVGNLLIDHKDRNGLNNQRDNLRGSTKSQNCKNRRAHGRSKFLGVDFKGGKWQARIMPDVGKKRLYLGRFDTEREAAIAYNVAARKWHKEFANLNVI